VTDVDRIRAAIAERRKLAQDATPGPWRDGPEDPDTWIVYDVDLDDPGLYLRVEGANRSNEARHIAANDPAAVIKVCDAADRMLDEHNEAVCGFRHGPPCFDLGILAEMFGINDTEESDD
jgi:uncharacterized protein DUF6221